MSGQKAIEFTTQALTTAATEVKGVEHETHKSEGTGSIKTQVPSPKQLNGSAVFDQKVKD